MVDGISTVVAIYVVLGLNLASVGVERFAIADVYRMAPALQEPKTHSTSTATFMEDEEDQIEKPHSRLRNIYTPISTYLHHPAALSFLALSILYFTILNFGAQMITYLLTSGYTPLHISSICDPIRGGLWFVNWQLLCAAGAARRVLVLGESSDGRGGLIFARRLLFRMKWNPHTQDRSPRCKLSV
ncbi:hypothetical protein L873DRAFT_36417 [Choiromyces venosus 120613-1]|uniref:Solute carrier family 40 member n=1 Tax=Choiromyces venosus 120613-1 TaxID=1336337 RepID=A0A3N4K042_9PEZI|nr:hypothetical protein L873DRAFT_36417 [Choiromyces venosus 120613-1]